MEGFDKPLLPKAKHVSPRTIGMDIMPYIPGDKKNNEEWDKVMKGIYQNVKDAFDKKGIPMPSVQIVSDQGPVRLPETIVNNMKRYVIEADSNACLHVDCRLSHMKSVIIDDLNKKRFRHSNSFSLKYLGNHDFLELACGIHLDVSYANNTLAILDSRTFVELEEFSVLCDLGLADHFDGFWEKNPPSYKYALIRFNLNPSGDDYAFN